MGPDLNKMLCAYCGRENLADAEFCESCGKELTSHLGRMSVLLLLFVSVITLGIYIPIWFLKKRQTINSLASTKKLGSGLSVFLLLIYSIDAVIFLVGFVIETSLDLDPISDLITSIGAIIIEILSFKVRGIFNEHFNHKQQRNIKFSGVATFFFTILYLQYKINQIKKEPSAKKPSGLWYLLPIFLNIIGGIIGYFAIKDRDKKMAKHMLYVGLIMVAVGVIGIFTLMPSLIWIEKGNSYVRSGEYEKAIDCFNKAIEMDPNEDLAYYNRGVTYLELNQYEQAIEDFNKTIALNPDWVDAYRNRGVAYRAIGEYERAIEDYDKAIALNPNFAGAYMNRGNAYDDLKQHERAIEDYNKAIELDPNEDLAYYNRGIAYSRLNQYERAIEDLNKALELNPNNMAAYYNRERALSNLQEQKTTTPTPMVTLMPTP